MSGKRIFIFFSAIICCLQVAVWPALAMEGPRVSVLSFEGNAGVDYCQLAANKLVSILTNDFSLFTVIERGEIDQILGEQHFQAAGLVDETKAVELGRLLAVDIAFIGRIDLLSYNFPQAEARVTIKGIDVGSGKLLHIIEGYGTAQNVNGQIAMRNAVEDCFSEHFVSALRRRFVPYSIVSAVEGDFLYFRNGRDIGIKKGMQYRILRPRLVNEEVIYKKEIGTAEVTDVSGNVSQAKIIKAAEEIKEGNYLEEIPPEPKQPPVNEKEVQVSARPPVEKSKKDPEPAAPVRTKIKREVNTFSYAPDLLDANDPFTLVEIRPRKEAEYFYHGTVLGLGYGEEKIYINAGFELGIHLPVVPRFFALTLGGTAGYSYLHQGSLEDFFESNNSSHGFCYSFSAGVKLYLFGYNGLRLEYDKFTHHGPGDFKIKGHRVSVGIPL